MSYGVKLTESRSHAQELASAVLAEACEPWTPEQKHKPWDPDRASFATYLCQRLKSRYGNEIQSYRVTMASFELTEEVDTEWSSESSPAALVRRGRVEARYDRRCKRLAEKVAGDALVVVLLETPPDEPPAPDPAGASDDERPIGAVEEEEWPPKPPPPPPPKPEPKQREAQPASTRRAVALGYTLLEIKNARERLKRAAIAVVDEERGREHIEEDPHA